MTHRLCDFPSDALLHVFCLNCARTGRLRTETLVNRYGHDTPTSTAADWISRDAPCESRTDKLWALGCAVRISEEERFTLRGYRYQHSKTEAIATVMLLGWQVADRGVPETHLREYLTGRRQLPLERAVTLQFDNGSIITCNQDAFEQTDRTSGHWIKIGPDPEFSKLRAELDFHLAQKMDSD